MRKRNLRLPVVLLLFALVAMVAVGCGKADNFERNMQYVSDEILYHDAGRAWETVNTTRAQWIKAGASRDKDDAAFQTYSDAYRHYAVIYNEIMDRLHAPITKRLRGVTSELPPSPPAGIPASTPQPKSPAKALPETGSLAPDLDGIASQPLPADPVNSILTDTTATEQTLAASDDTPAAAATSRQHNVVKTGGDSSRIAREYANGAQGILLATGMANSDKQAFGQSLVLPVR